ncbi:MAG: outer membrane lipoprotein carrier protein LolA [Proteobacteria bacterium]|nr:outer membrane lipoprotein carrier protein LolA [Pseudomonadota bacterium]MBU4296449.1 outer membrane lipoprotein carrier protein LolA [Pseudomonadota bacterium]MCG2748718.1 outer membrane lipoprotein carrier protein LolA [Desulfobulbaceae bacterium]
MKHLLLIVLTLLVPIRALAGEPTQQIPVRLHSVQADFVQEKHLKILARPIISTGTFIFQAPQSLRWEYQSPIASVLLMHDGKLKKYMEHDGKFQEERGMGLDSMQVVLAEISNWLDGRFTDNEMFTVSFPDKQTILLTPKEQGFAALISRIRLKLADQQGLLDEVTIFEGPDSYTRLTFTNSILNREIPVSRFNVR